MKKKTFLAFILISNFLFSQKEEKFDQEFLGVLLLGRTQLFSYKLEFNTFKDSIKGYSYTDLGGENETKSYIFGTYNKKNKDFYFEEKDILYTKSHVSRDEYEFCFVKSKGKLQLKSNKNSYESDFYGVFYTGDTCATGKIKVVGTKFAQKKLNKLYKKIENKKRIDSVSKEKFKPNKILTKFGKTTITDEETITIFLKNQKAEFEIWDYGKEDGDIVDIYINNKKVLPNLKIKKEKKSLYLNLKEGINNIKITTVSAGTIQTNTTKVKIYDSSRFYEFTSNIEKGKSAEINIIFKK